MLESGLVIPEGSSEEYGLVYAAGPDCKHGLKKGDRVMLWRIQEGDVGSFRWGDADYAMIHESLIACILPGELPASPMIKPERGMPAVLIQ